MIKSEDEAVNSASETTGRSLCALDTQSVIRCLDHCHDQHHVPLNTLKLLSYATDAMRVLTTLERQAEASPVFAAAITQACPDWRNPGAAYDPQDLLAGSLLSLSQDFQGIFEKIRGVTEAMRLQPLTSHAIHQGA